ncbi:MAG: hypothetical protein LBV40_02610 [Methanomicrobiales archaeon]|nr:hypothetical protein [Methanomicrobiales archaeon]
MKRDTGASEVIAGLILIFITVSAAGIVLSVIMDTPTPNIPVLEYYGCTVDNTETCLVHTGGETLYHGTYYLRGLDASQQPLYILEWGEFLPSDFKMGIPICIYNNTIHFIQLHIIDGSRHVLHGTVSVDPSCPGEIVHQMEA